MAIDYYLYQDTKDLVAFYHSNQKFREDIQQAIKNARTGSIYIRVNGRIRPLKSYLAAIEAVAPNKYLAFTRSKPQVETIDRLFRTFYFDKDAWQKLQSLTPQIPQIGEEIKEQFQPPNTTQESTPEVSKTPTEQAKTNLPPEYPKPLQEQQLPEKEELPTQESPSAESLSSPQSQTPEVVLSPSQTTPTVVPTSSEALEGAKEISSVKIREPVGTLKLGIPPTPPKIVQSVSSKALGTAGQAGKFLSSAKKVTPLVSTSGKVLSRLTFQGAKKVISAAVGSVIGVATGGLGFLLGALVSLLIDRLLNPNLIKRLIIYTFALIGGVFLLFFVSKNIRDTSFFPPIKQDIINKLIIYKTGPTAVENGSEIRYEITVSYSGSGPANIEVNDTLPAEAEFVSASDNGSVENNLVTWRLASVPSGGSKTLQLVVKPTQDDIWLVNSASANIVTVGPIGVIDVKSQSLAMLFENAARYAGIPVAFLKALARVESKAITSYSDEEVVKFSTIGWWVGKVDNAPRLEDNDPDIVRGYGYNTCAYLTDSRGYLVCPNKDVRGVMQFELQTWEGIKGRLIFPDAHDPDRRNMTDNVFGAAMLNKMHAEALGVTETENWNEETVRALARWYCAGPAAVKNPALVKTLACGYRGDQTYDDRVWEYYKYYQTNQL